MHSCVRDVVVGIGDSLLFQQILMAAQHLHELGRKMNRVEQSRREGGMTACAVEDRAGCQLALMPEPDRHRRRLSDDTKPKWRRREAQFVKQRSDADTADLLIVGKRNVQRRGYCAARRKVGGAQRAGDVAFHVGCAAAKQFLSPWRQHKRIRAPCLTLNRDDIGMAGQDDAR